MPRNGSNKLPGEGRHVRAEVGHLTRADAGQPFDMEKTVAQIRYFHRLRGYHMEQRKRSDLSLGAFLRMALGWSKALPEADRKRIAAQAQALVDIGEAEAKGKPLETDEPAYLEWRDTILATIQSRAPHDELEKRAKKEMERLAVSLPAWAAFGETVRGFGAVSLAVIVGEAGDLSQYASHSKLWKRMGLAVMGDVRQGGLRKTASKEDWIEHGYSAKRRSHMFVIGDVLVKMGERYREIYLARKEYERAKAVERGLAVVPAAKIPKGRTAEFMSDGHVHKRAQRYMEKRLLRDLWRAWRDERTAIRMLPETARRRAPSALPNEGLAVRAVLTEADVSLPTPLPMPPYEYQKEDGGSVSIPVQIASVETRMVGPFLVGRLIRDDRDAA